MMKTDKKSTNKIKIVWFVALIIALGGCERTEVPEPMFTVTTEQESYVVGEEVVFVFTGEPRLISFKSGEPDNDSLVALKGYLNTDLGSYTYVYTEPGTYKATFIASNTTIYDSKMSTHQVDITILPRSEGGEDNTITQ